jgi:hypothetical protein
VAGPTITVGSIRRQRCAWCGALLEEQDLSRIARPLEPGEDPDNPKPWEPGAWETGAHVRLSGTNPRFSSLEEHEPHPEDPSQWQVPEDSCMALDDTVTT